VKLNKSGPLKKRFNLNRLLLLHAKRSARQMYTHKETFNESYRSIFKGRHS